MTIGWRSAIRLGLGLILAGSAWYGGWAWRAQRLEISGTWRPLDMPVSLAAGQLRAADFEIKVPSMYYVELVCAWDRDQGFGAQDFLASWRLRSGNQIVAQGEKQLSCNIGDSFTASEGRYVLEFIFRESPPWRRTQTPQLMISEMGGKREPARDDAALAFGIGLLCVTAGFCVIVGHAVYYRNEMHDCIIRGFPLTEAGPQAPVFGTIGSTAVRTLHLPQPGTTPALSLLRLRQFSLVLLLVLVPITFSQWLLWIQDTTEPYAGLNVRLVPRLSPRSTVGAAPVLVYVDAKRVVYVDSQPVAWNGLAAAVRKAVVNRPLNWPVFVDAAIELEYQWPAHAMDIIRGTGLEVAMVSPGQRNGGR